MVSKSRKTLFDGPVVTATALKAGIKRLKDSGGPLAILVKNLGALDTLNEKLRGLIYVLASLAEDTAHRKKTKAKDSAALLALRLRLIETIRRAKDTGMLDTAAREAAMLAIIETVAEIGVRHEGSSIKRAKMVGVSGAHSAKWNERKAFALPLIARVVEQDKTSKPGEIEKMIRAKLANRFGKSAPKRTTVLGWIKSFRK